MNRYIHSALAGNHVSNSKPRNRAELPSGVAFTFDITQGFLPVEYNSCDVLFSMMPWRAGYKEFNRRANITEKRQWLHFVEMVSRIISSISTPVVLMWGKHVEKDLPQYDWSVPSKEGLIFYGWRLPRPPASKLLTREQMLMGLCVEYSCIGDFCCGYGETGIFAQSAGKSFVLSDFNANCIGEVWNRLVFTV